MRPAPISAAVVAPGRASSFAASAPVAAVRRQCSQYSSIIASGLPVALSASQNQSRAASGASAIIRKPARLAPGSTAPFTLKVAPWPLRPMAGGFESTWRWVA